MPLFPPATRLAEVVPLVSSNGSHNAMPAGGGTHDTTVMVWLQVLTLPHRSLAVQVRVMNWGHTPLVVVEKVSDTLVGLQSSSTWGGSKLHVLPQGTVLLLAQVRVGG